VTGIELINKMTNHDDAYIMTSPLLLDSTGKKFGKSEGNAIRLDKTKNSPYFVYQYFLNVADADIERLLKVFTLYEFDTINQIVATHAQDPASRYGQQMLAEYVVRLIFGEDEARQSKMISHILFGKEDILETIKNLSASDLDALQKETGGSQFPSGTYSILEIIVQS
jgi:tyrosyl-tRNA synthetase